MTNLIANALEQDADDDADAVDSWMLYLRAPALTLDADEVLQSRHQSLTCCVGKWDPGSWSLRLKLYEGTKVPSSYEGVFLARFFGSTRIPRVCSALFAEKSVRTIKSYCFTFRKATAAGSPTIFPVFGPFISRTISGKITSLAYTLCKVLYHHKNDRLQA